MLKKFALVTGASSGVGKAISIALAKKKCDLLITYFSNKQGALETKLLCEKRGVQCHVVKADLGTDKGCNAILNKLKKETSYLNYLINNGGTTKIQDFSNLSSISRKDFNRIYEVNTIGAFELIKGTYELLLNVKQAHIVNIASNAGIFPTGSSIPYGCSKAALIMMTKYLANTLGPKIQINAVCPGFIEGNWWKSLLGNKVHQEMKTFLKKQVPLQKVCSPEAVVETILYCLNPKINMTGQALVVDGGQTLKVINR